MISAAVSATLVYLIIGRLRATGKFKWLFVIRYGLPFWGLLNNLTYSVLHHLNSGYAANRSIQVIGAMYSAAVGLFFGILMVVGTTAELEMLIPEEHLRSARVRGGYDVKALSQRDPGGDGVFGGSHRSDADAHKRGHDGARGHTQDYRNRRAISPHDPGSGHISIANHDSAADPLDG
jgi:hypothetical protein